VLVIFSFPLKGIKKRKRGFWLGGGVGEDAATQKNRKKMSELATCRPDAELVDEKGVCKIKSGQDNLGHKTVGLRG
jgi:hypothetical protein